MSTALIISQDAMGHGDAELGRGLLQNAFNKASAFRQLEAIVFYNAGVKALVRGSPYLQTLSALHDQGVDLIACGTCVDHFGVRETIALGKVGTMDEILGALEAADKVITL